MSTRIAPGVVQIDTLLGGWGEVTAGYLVEGPEPCLVETGSQSSLPTVLAELDALGLGPADLATVVVTHIHLDHAGGVGDIAAAFPRATVLVHEKGARHLVDPDRLVRSAALVYGDLLDALYGRLTPTPADRVRVLGDGEEIRIGPGRTLTSIDSPGHAKHHLGLHDSESGLLFVGDAVGVRLPQVGVLRPATPPPDFDLDLALQSLQRFAARRPAGLALAHYGVTPGDPLDLLAEAASTLQGWAAVAEAAFRDGRDIAAALDEALTQPAPCLMCAETPVWRFYSVMTEPLLKPCEGFSLKVEVLEPLMRVQTYSWPGPEYVGLGPAPKKHRPWLEWIRTKIFSLPPRFIPAEIWRRFPINDWTTSWKALGEEDDAQGRWVQETA
jgi:glyoxylase-like metal-dependent hydrolase (beta-lactamase superfamily II)